MTVEELRKNDMMSHLLDALDGGKDIGHYGRLVFAMVARHFLSEDELISYLQQDSDFSEAEARSLYKQVQGKDYNPPAGNVYWNGSSTKNSLFALTLMTPIVATYTRTCNSQNTFMNRSRNTTNTRAIASSHYKTANTASHAVVGT